MHCLVLLTCRHVNLWGATTTDESAMRGGGGHESAYSPNRWTDFDAILTRNTSKEPVWAKEVQWGFSKFPQNCFTPKRSKHPSPCIYLDFDPLSLATFMRRSLLVWKPRRWLCACRREKFWFWPAWGSEKNSSNAKHFTYEQHECELILISTSYPLAKLMRHTPFECLLDSTVDKRFVCFLSQKFIKCETFPILSCLQVCELLLISTCYPWAKLMRHTSFEMSYRLTMLR